jgi:hypothetical protein
MTDYRAVARAFAIKYGIDPDNFAAQINQESGFNPRARSPAGARGIAQIMPATAAGWGVNPDDPKAALAAAAKNMKRYLDAYGGSWAKALTAYNAGPGRVGKPLFPETANYIKRILGGKSDSRNVASVSPPSARAAKRPAAQAPSGPAEPDYVGQILSRRMRGSLLDRLGLLEEPDAPPPQQSAVQPSSPGRPKSPQGGSARFAPGDLKELFWQGQGGIDVKNGQRVPQGFVSGHTDHVHVASGPKRTVQLGELAQRMGLHVGENPRFGGVAPVHVQGSYHYRDQAIDVSGDPRKMAAYAHTVARMFGR